MALLGFRYLQNLPFADINNSPCLWAVVDAACNSSAVSEGWLSKASTRLKPFGLGLRWVHRRGGGYGGIGTGAETVGAVMWPDAIGSYKDHQSFLTNARGEPRDRPVARAVLGSKKMGLSRGVARRTSSKAIATCCGAWTCNAS